MYTGATPYQCDIPYNEDWPASQHHEEADALQFAGWNAVYVKADNCFGPDDTLIQRFTNMSNALRGVGIEGLLVCEWGVPANGPGGSSDPIGPAIWAPPIATSYRVGADIAQGWGSVFRLTNEAIHIILQGNSGPGQFGDMDLLEVGNPGMTTTEQATHFAIWSMFKSALFISTNVPNMASETQDILQNEGLISINQDSLGQPVGLLQRYPNYDIYSGPLSNGDVALLLVDQAGNGGNLSVDFARLNISQATATDLWSGKVSQQSRSWAAEVEPHGSVALRLSNIQKRTAPIASYTYLEGSSGALANGASLQSCSVCSSGQAVGYIGGGQSNGGGSVTYSNITTSLGTQNIKIDYVNCEVSYPNESGPNARGAQISVNGGNPVQIMFPMSGYNWQSSVLKGFLVELTGFSTTGPNNMTITGIPGGVANTSNYGPNIAGISVAK